MNRNELLDKLLKEDRELENCFDGCIYCKEEFSKERLLNTAYDVINSKDKIIALLLSYYLQ